MNNMKAVAKLLGMGYGPHQKVMQENDITVDNLEHKTVGKFAEVGVSLLLTGALPGDIGST